MQTYDIIMLVVLAVAVGFGLWKGLVWQLASLASLFLSYVVAFMFRGPLAAYITTDPPWNIFLSMLILYVGTALGIWVVFHFVSGIIEKLKLKEFDSQLGGLFGLAKGLVLCAVITLFAVTLLGDDLKKTILGSHSGYYLALGLDQLDAVMPKELHDVVGPYLHPLSEQVGGNPHGQAATDPAQPPPVADFGKSPAPVLPTLAIAKEAITKELKEIVPREFVPPFGKPDTAKPANVDASLRETSFSRSGKPVLSPASPTPMSPPSQPSPAAEQPAAAIAARPAPEAAPASVPMTPSVTVLPLPRPAGNGPPAPAPFPSATPVAPASWPAQPGSYDPYAGPPRAFGK